MMPELRMSSVFLKRFCWFTKPKCRTVWGVGARWGQRGSCRDGLCGKGAGPALGLTQPQSDPSGRKHLSLPTALQAEWQKFANGSMALKEVKRRRHLWKVFRLWYNFEWSKNDSAYNYFLAAALYLFLQHFFWKEKGKSLSLVWIILFSSCNFPHIDLIKLKVALKE